MHQLSLVSTIEPPQNRNKLLVVRPPLPARIITTGTRAITVPLVSLLLGDYCRVTGMVDTQSPYGEQMECALEYIEGGIRRPLIGALIPLTGIAADLVLPADFFLRN